MWSWKVLWKLKVFKFIELKKRIAHFEISPISPRVWQRKSDDIIVKDIKIKPMAPFLLFLQLRAKSLFSFKPIVNIGLSVFDNKITFLQKCKIKEKLNQSFYIKQTSRCQRFGKVEKYENTRPIFREPIFPDRITRPRCLHAIWANTCVSFSPIHERNQSIAIKTFPASEIFRPERSYPKKNWFIFVADWTNGLGSAVNYPGNVNNFFGRNGRSTSPAAVNFIARKTCQILSISDVEIRELISISRGGNCGNAYDETRIGVNISWYFSTVVRSSLWRLRKYSD